MKSFGVVGWLNTTARLSKYLKAESYADLEIYYLSSQKYVHVVYGLQGGKKVPQMTGNAGGAGDQSLADDDNDDDSSSSSSEGDWEHSLNTSDINLTDESSEENEVEEEVGKFQKIL